jgi:hypothetical protein
MIRTILVILRLDRRALGKFSARRALLYCDFSSTLE